jgi:hypothetical protein
MRTLLRVIGMKNNSRVNLKIEEPEGYVKPEGSSPSIASADVDQTMEDLKGI